jgi:hypothetical protein
MGKTASRRLIETAASMPVPKYFANPFQDLIMPVGKQRKYLKPLLVTRPDDEQTFPRDALFSTSIRAGRRAAGNGGRHR